MDTFAAVLSTDAIDLFVRYCDPHSSSFLALCEHSQALCSAVLQYASTTHNQMWLVCSLCGYRRVMRALFADGLVLCKTRTDGYRQNICNNNPSMVQFYVEQHFIDNPHIGWKIAIRQRLKSMVRWFCAYFPVPTVYDPMYGDIFRYAVVHAPRLVYILMASRHFPLESMGDTILMAALHGKQRLVKHILQRTTYDLTRVLQNSIQCKDGPTIHLLLARYTTRLCFPTCGAVLLEWALKVNAQCILGQCVQIPDMQPYWNHPQNITQVLNQNPYSHQTFTMCLQAPHICVTDQHYDLARNMGKDGVAYQIYEYLQDYVSSSRFYRFFFKNKV